MLVAAAALLFFPAGFALCLSEYDRPSRMFVAPVAPGQSFTVSYTHSVNRGRIFDEFDIMGDRTLRLTRTRFVSWGAGMSDPSEGGFLEKTADGYQMNWENREFRSFLLSVALLGDHRIEMADGVSVLADLFAPQTRVLIECRAVSVFDRIRSRVLFHQG